MTPKEIENAIQFTVRHPTHDRPFTDVTASITFTAFARIHPEEIKISRDNLIRFHEDRLKELIMRKIFADQRKAIHEAIMELALCDPYSANAHEVRDKLMNLAIRGGAEL